MGNGTLTSWLIKAQNIKDKFWDFPIKENKLEEIQKLINSGLKTYKYVFVPLSDFLIKDSIIRSHYLEFDNRVVVRIVSKGNNLKRYTYINKDYIFIKEQIKQNIQKESFLEYIVVLNIYDPAKYCGVIISSPWRLVVEVVESENLEGLCHGHVTPWHAEFSGRKMYRYKTMTYQEPVPIGIRKKMWRTIKCISKTELRHSSIFPNIIPKLGYFEFVISKKDNSLKFIDYKEALWQSI